MKPEEVTELVERFDRLTEVLKVTFNRRPPLLNGERYMTTAAICGLLHISQRTLQNFRDTGVIPYIHLSGKTLYKESDVLKLLEDNYIKNKRSDFF